MASSHKKRTGLRAALIVLLCLVLVCAVAAAVLYSFVSRKIKAFQSGASFALDYTITSTEAEPPALYALLDKFGGTTGSLTGQYTPRAVQLALYPTGTSTVNDAPLTRMYISEEETLYDAGQLYNKLRSTVVAEYPLASLLLPGWSLGSYISQDQLATLLGVDPAATGLQQVNDFQLDLKQLKTVQPANAKEGYLYLQLPNLTAGEDAPQLILGIEKQGLLKTLSPKVHILLDVPAHHIHAELTGTVTAAQTVVTAPTSRMQDSDVESLVQLRKTIESIVQFVQTAAQSDDEIAPGETAVAEEVQRLAVGVQIFLLFPMGEYEVLHLKSGVLQGSFCQSAVQGKHGVVGNDGGPAAGEKLRRHGSQLGEKAQLNGHIIGPGCGYMDGSQWPSTSSFRLRPSSSSWTRPGRSLRSMAS